MPIRSQALAVVCVQALLSHPLAVNLLGFLHHALPHGDHSCQELSLATQKKHVSKTPSLDGLVLGSIHPVLFDGLE